MIDTQAIRSKILDLAMRGQLTEQLPEDGNAEELYQQIQKEKQKLIKVGKIKKQKPLPKINDEEIPFDIPKNWKWVRLSDLVYLTSGNQYEDVLNGLPYVKVADMNLDVNAFEIITSSRFASPENIGRIPTSSIIFPKRGGAISTNKKRIVRTTEIYIDSNTMAMTMFFPSILLYAKIWFDSIDLASVQTGTSIPQINNKDIYPLLFPLPPLAEQKRIVEKIEQAFSVLDTIDELRAQYADNLTALKSKLIDAAIQGKLTEQLPEDGTAEELYQQIQEEKQKLIKEGKIKKQKPLPEIPDEEIPFDIPKNWKWKRFADVLDVRDGTHDTPKYVTEGIPLVTSKNLRKGLIDFESAKLISYEDAKQINNRSRVDDGDILLAMIGTIGNPVLVKKDREFSIKNMALFKPIDSNLLDMSYVLYYLKNEERVMQEKARGGLQPFVSLKLLRTSIIPLPPLTEQKRIVQKLNVILPLCK